MGLRHHPAGARDTRSGIVALGLRRRNQPARKQT
jgi:hypothetical protein